MQCFIRDRLQGPWESDPLCVARGALVSRSPFTPSVQLACRLRNFSSESQESVEDATKYEVAQDVDKMGSYFFGTGAGEEFKPWRFSNAAAVEPPCSAKSNNGQWILLADREGNVNLWHKLMEIWQATISIEAIRLARDPATGKPYLTEEASEVRVDFEDNHNEPLDDWWTLVTGNKPVRIADLPESDCYGNAIVPLAGSSSPFWTFLLEERLHEVCHVRTLIDTFVRRILAHVQVRPRLETEIYDNPVVTIIDRKQTRKFHGLSHVVEVLQQRFPQDDVPVGHHGAGMTHVLFLPPDAAVVEIFPPVFGILGFRHVARNLGFAHFVGHCMFFEEWNAAVHNISVPAGWIRPTTAAGW
ncbi:hypothetical protein B0H63DRAFT_547322 [Podospora didyma]|uniref:Uncharacterized protein n=1 Tax=Podospora didyma TaxID=330526 RepID=A0AAE0KKI7_9PEZI|nr:hypothetical protein B0H63DRAFT_547322 [Podospora didyma]